MTKPIWDGGGELPPDTVYFTTRDGTIRGRAYVKYRVQSYLSRWRRITTVEERARAVAATIDNDAWLAQRNGYLVSALCHAVESALLAGEY